MKELSPYKVFVQYRDTMRPYEPVQGRKYTITHSDTTGELFVFVASDYAKDQITNMRDEVKIMWHQTEKGLVLVGSVLVDNEDTTGNSSIRFNIFYKEIPVALIALRSADRFLFEKDPKLDNTPVLIDFISSNPLYDKTYNYGMIGMYQ